MSRSSTMWELISEIIALFIACLFTLGVLLIVFGLPILTIVIIVYAAVYAAITALKATGVIHLVAMLI